MVDTKAPKLYRNAVLSGPAVYVEATARELRAAGYVPASELEEANLTSRMEQHSSHREEKRKLTEKLEVMEKELELLREIERTVRLGSHLGCSPVDNALAALDAYRTLQQPTKRYRVISQKDRLYGRTGVFEKREGELIWLCFENELAPVAFYCKALEPAPEPTAGTRIGTCVGCKTPRCALDDDPYCCKLCRNRNAPASNAKGSAGAQPEPEADHLSEAERHICDVIMYSPKNDPLWSAVRGALRELSLDAEQRRAKEAR